MALDIDALVAPLSEDAPSGPDLSYDDERIQIESAFERTVSEGGAGEDDTDWRGTIALITAQMERTRDLWLPVYLMRAAAQSKQFGLLVEAAELMARMVEERWADMHPQLDEYGFIGRKTPCESLTRIADFLRPLSNVPLVEHPRLGRFSGSDFERFHDQGSGADGYGMFRAALDATAEDDLRGLVDKIDTLRLAIRRTDTVMTGNAEGDTATNFQTTYDALDRIRRAVAAHLPAEQAAPADSGGADDGWSAAPASGGSVMPSGPGFSGGINSRDDVVRAIDAIVAYYNRVEPSSPVPFVLLRAREWISLDFMAVLEDIAPGSLGEASRILKTNGRAASNESVGQSAAPVASVDSASADNSWSGTSDDGW